MTQDSTQNSTIKNHSDNTKNEKYREAITSAHWKELRKVKYRAQQGRCSGCKRYHHLRELELHHFHYETLGKENPSDVTLVCKFCHWIADRRRIIKKSILTFCEKYYDNRNKECPQHVLNDFITKELLPSLPSPESRGIEMPNYKGEEDKDYAKEVVDDYYY